MKIGSNLINSIPFLRKKPEASAAPKPWQEPTIVKNTADANVACSDPAQVRQAVQANLAKETAALSKLSETQQKQYQAIVSALPTSDPEARQSLQNLLLTGRLPGSKDYQGGGDLLANLSSMVAAPMQSDLAKERGTLIGDMIQELDDPTCIAQKGKGTCGATTAQIILARENPAEYVRLMTGLASPNGSVELSNGGRIKREPGTETDDGSDRSIGTRLMAPAFMEYASKALDYDNAKDGQGIGDARLYGLMNGQENALLEAVLKRDYKTVVVGPLNKSASVTNEIAKVASENNPVPISMTYEGNELFGNGHFLQVTGIKDGQVTMINPWGRVEQMSVEQFQEHLMSAFMPNASAGIKDKLQNAGNSVAIGAEGVGQVIEKKLPGIEEKVSQGVKDIGNWISKHLPWN